MTSSLKNDQAGLAARRARVQLLEALRRLPRGAGSGCLPALAPLLFTAADFADEPEADEELCAELIRVLGAELGEHTPTSVREAALLALRHRSSDREQTQREALTPIAGELRASLGLLREIDASEVSPATVSALRQAGCTLEVARRLGKMETGYFTAEPGTLIETELEPFVHAEPVETGRARPLRPRQARAEGPGAQAGSVSAPAEGPEPTWDHLALFTHLVTHYSRALHRLATVLSRIHQPLRIDPAEAVQVASSILGATTPLSPRAALLELVRLLDPLCARAPLSTADLDHLIELGRRADLARDDPDWAKVANRLWTLRSRLLGSKKPLTPLERSLAPHPANRSARRPPTLEAILRRLD